MMFSRPLTNSERFRHRESSVYAIATLPGSREFQPSSASLTFSIALSRVNGGKGGRVVVAVAIISSPFGSDALICQRKRRRTASSGGTVDQATVDQVQERRTCIILSLIPLRKLPSLEASPSLCLLLRDPFVRARFEKIEWKASAIQHFIVEGTDVELGSQFFACAFAQLDELELAD